MECLAGEVAPVLFRAATDNDRGGSGGTSYAARWAAAGLDRLVHAGAHLWLVCSERALLKIVVPVKLLNDGGPHVPYVPSRNARTVHHLWSVRLRTCVIDLAINMA